jgi:NAD(P)H-quinone oxidoreductase subunit 2
MRPLQVSLIVAVVATSLAGILSNPLFTLANSSITRTPLLKASIEQAVATTSQPQSADLAVLFTDQP